LRLLFINRFYWPETPATGQLLTDLAEGLAAKGWDVTVITSAARNRETREETHGGVRIVRLRSTRWAALGSIGKAVDFTSFFIAAVWRVWREARAGTVVIPMTDPPMLGVGVGWAARHRRAGLIHWIQDIYPEIAIELLRQRWLGLLRPLRDRAWRAADQCVTLGSDMAHVLTKVGVTSDRIQVIPNWAPAGLTPHPRSAAMSLRQEWGLAGKFVIAYSGNLGRVHDLEAILVLAEALREDPEIIVVLVGDGAQRECIQRMARQRSQANVRFFPSQPRQRLGELLSAGDLHLVTLLPGCEHYVLPSKLYGIVAVGRPVLFIGPSDCGVAQLVRDHGLGCAADRSDLNSMTAFVRRLAGKPADYETVASAARVFAKGHTAQIGIDRWGALLKRTVATLELKNEVPMSPPA
jgi:colanic acid biosynthesis glycosyl transferase WcaI